MITNTFGQHLMPTNVSIFFVINGNGSVNFFYGWIFPNFEGLDNFIVEKIPSDRFSCILKSFQWLVIDGISSESRYFKIFKSRTILMMRFGNFIYPPDMKKVKAF